VCLGTATGLLWVRDNVKFRRRFRSPPMRLSLLGANSNPCVRRHPQVIVNALEIFKPRRTIDWTSGRIRACMRTAAPVLSPG
jgi:hypothetical protein